MLAAAEGVPGRRTAAAFREEYMMVKKDAKQKKVRITNCETCAFYTHATLTNLIKNFRIVNLL